MNYIPPTEYPTTIPTISSETMDMYIKNRGLNTYNQESEQVNRIVQEELNQQINKANRIVQEELRKKTEWYKTPSGIFWITLLLVIIAVVFLIIVFKSDK